MTSFDNSQPRPIRLLAANLPELWVQLVVDRIDSESDMVLAGYVKGDLETLVAASDHVDVVILGVQHDISLPGIGTHLLTEFPHLKVIVVATSSDRIVGYWLGLKRQEMVLETVSDLVSSIREFYQLDPLDE